MIKKILVCVDGSIPYTDSCLNYAAFLIRSLSVKAEVVYVSNFRQMEVSMVADFSGSLGIQPYQGLLSQIETIENEKAKILEKYVYDFFDKHQLRDSVVFEHKIGYLVDMIEDFELDEEDPIGLTILGKRGENADFASEHLGSTMERIIRVSTKPCLIAAREYKSVQKVLFAYDGSESCEKALHFFKNQFLFKELEFHLLSVMEDEEEDKDIESKQKSAKDILTMAGYKVHPHVAKGSVEDVVCKFVEENKIDLLIIGAYGHSIWRYLFLGSTTTELLYNCQIPVLVFHQD